MQRLEILEILSSVLIGLLSGLLLVPPSARAQGQDEASEGVGQFFPRNSYLLTGYGSVGYDVVFAEGDSQPNNFSAAIVLGRHRTGHALSDLRSLSL